MASALAQPAGDSRSGDPRPTLTVSATAEVPVQPDQATVRLGVLAEADEAADAQNQVNRIMATVLQAVRDLDVPEQAVRTEDLSLNPVYNTEQPQPRAAQNDEPRIVGYRASNVVSIQLEDLERIGEVIDAGIEAGANQLYGISFGLMNDAEARADAMSRAVEEARMQADTIAAAMGLDIDGVSEIAAGGYADRPPVPFAGARLAANIAATSVQPGEIDVAANVTVTFFVTEGSASADE